MWSALNTSTTKSPPLELWLTVSGARQVHSAIDPAAMVRDFVWDDQPMSLQHFAGSAVRDCPAPSAMLRVASTLSHEGRGGKENIRRIE